MRDLSQWSSIISQNREKATKAQPRSRLFVAMLAPFQAPKRSCSIHAQIGLETLIGAGNLGNLSGLLNPG